MKGAFARRAEAFVVRRCSFVVVRSRAEGVRRSSLFVRRCAESGTCAVRDQRAEGRSKVSPFALARYFRIARTIRITITITDTAAITK